MENISKSYINKFKKKYNMKNDFNTLKNEKFIKLPRKYSPRIRPPLVVYNINLKMKKLFIE